MIKHNMNLPEAVEESNSRIAESLKGKKVIAIDLDGVIYDWQLAVHDYLSFLDATDLSLYDFWTEGYKNYNRLFWENMAMDGALYTKFILPRTILDSLKSLTELGFDLVYVTARPIQVYFSTVKWAKASKLPMLENIVFDPDKFKYANDLCSYFIEDSPRYFKNIDHSKVTCFRVYNPVYRNVETDYTINVNSIGEAVDMIRSF